MAEVSLGTWLSPLFMLVLGLKLRSCGLCDKNFQQLNHLTSPRSYFLKQCLLLTWSVRFGLFVGPANLLVSVPQVPGHKCVLDTPSSDVCAGDLGPHA